MFKSLLCTLIILFTSCSVKNNEEPITVELESKSLIKNVPFPPLITSFSYSNTIPQDIKGAPEADSSAILRYRIYKAPDQKSVENEKNYIYASTGFTDDKQFYIIDRNGNKDFSDDEKVTFPKNIGLKTHANKSLIDSFPRIKLKVNKYINSTLLESEMHLTVYPQQYYLARDENKKIIAKKQKTSFLGARIEDYLHGTFSIEDKKYKMAININSWRPSVLVEEFDKEFYKPGDTRREEYKFLDTINIGGSYYRIGKIKNDPIRLNLTKLSIEENVYGFRKGQIIEDYAIEDVQGGKQNIKALFNGRKFLLIDFWGTWCGPCKKMTPEIVAFNEKYKDKVTMASFAFQQDAQPVIEYAAKNNMDWFNGIIKGVPKSSSKTHPKILKDLRIIAFPTFILLDENLKIIYRGAGNTNNIEEIELILKDRQ
ncbi:TlpA disulfide reductase family protein [Galbibacter sp. EGI 63066]|uniref:TlpA family protein disulfide reductase n=1 Tax=Galbibacter sp. EGI 63066 TaxID=2993559 RepID=UPI002248827D|nr:TlpA disulfide reductase family protein [Galbibacter sp. EGI 63066]MCX2678781.1 TlpA disulfide reductase family protein [Galbibacter sp. EGI 63066]